MEKNSYIDKLAKEIEFYIERDGEVGYELLSRLEDLESYMEKENIPASELINYPALISLCSLRGDESLDDFFSKTGLEYSLKSLRDEIKNSKVNLNDLQVEQISALMKYDALEEDTQMFSNYVIECVIRGNHRFNYETLQKAFTNVIDEGLRKIDPGKYCEVVKDLRNERGEKLRGQKTPTGVKINEEYVRAMYEDGYYDVFETAFHEMFHIYQDIRLGRLAKKFHPEEVIKLCHGEFFEVVGILKEQILSGKGYYHDNYEVHALEKEANIRAMTMCMAYFDSLHVLTPLMKEQLEEEIDGELHRQSNKLRLYNQRFAEIDDLVLENQDRLEETIREFPLLHMIYTRDEDGKYREKTKDELLLDYSDLEHNDQVNSVYRELIKRAESKNEPKSSKPNR